MTDTARCKENSQALWQALYERDWDKVGEFFAEDGLYQDVPTPDMGAIGPAAVARRLRIGHDPVERHEHTIFRMVAEGKCVITEHREDWFFHTGEVVKLPFTSIHEYNEAGKISLWRDYWDLSTLMNNAPAWWLEQIMAADGDEFASKETIE
ncbi:MAG: nuclear transport factor 2 family protein [Pseudomonadota bacterium]